MAVESVSSTSDAYYSGDLIDNGVLGKEDFLNLLVTQLKYQDPLDPMDNTEYVAQLAQFSSLEQLMTANDNLVANGDISLSLHNTMMSSLIGKVVKTAGDVIRIEGSNAADTGISYDVTEAGDVTVQILDDAGTVIRDIEIGFQDEGEHTLTWDGMDNDGNVVDDGDYQITATSTTTDGSEYEMSTYLLGRVTGIQFYEGNPVLYIGEQGLNPADIVGVFDDFYETS